MVENSGNNGSVQFGKCVDKGEHVLDNRRSDNYDSPNIFQKVANFHPPTVFRPLSVFFGVTWTHFCPFFTIMATLWDINF